MPHKQTIRFAKRAGRTLRRVSRTKRQIKRKVVRTIGRTAKRVVTQKAPSNLVMGTLPIGGGLIGAAPKGVGIVKRGVTTIKDFAGRATGNPLAGGKTLKAGASAFGKRVAGRALGLGLAVETFQFGRAKATGQPFDPIPDLGLIASAAINPLATFGGFGFGTGERVTTKAGEVLSDIIPPLDFGGQVPPQFIGGDTIITFPSNTGSFAPATPEPPIGAFFPSIDVNIPSPGGADILLPLLLALLAAGGGGFLLGKGKKKKSKKEEDLA